MQRSPKEDYVREFLEQILRAGLLLADLVDSLADLLPDDAYPDEANVEVVLDMMTGTIRPLAEEVGEDFVRAAITLVDDAHGKVLTDLRLAAEMGRMRETAPGREGTLN